MCLRSRPSGHCFVKRRRFYPYFFSFRTSFLGDVSSINTLIFLCDHRRSSASQLSLPAGSNRYWSSPHQFSPGVNRRYKRWSLIVPNPNLNPNPYRGDTNLELPSFSFLHTNLTTSYLPQFVRPNLPPCHCRDIGSRFLSLTPSKQLLTIELFSALLSNKSRSWIKGAVHRINDLKLITTFSFSSAQTESM